MKNEALKPKQLRYISDPKNKSWDDYFTIKKVYLEQEKINPAYGFTSVKDDFGDIKYVPSEVFEDVTDEVNEKFSKFIWRIVTILLWSIIFVISYYLWKFIINLF